MKVIKLNHRYRLYQDHGFKLGVKFNNYSAEARKLERYLIATYGHMWDNRNLLVRDPQWYGQYGSRQNCYYVAFKNEEMVMMATLAGVM